MTQKRATYHTQATFPSKKVQKEETRAQQQTEEATEEAQVEERQKNKGQLTQTEKKGIFTKIWHGIKWPFAKFSEYREYMNNMDLLERIRTETKHFYIIGLILFLILIPIALFFFRGGGLAAVWSYYRLFINPFTWIVIPVWLIWPTYNALNNRRTELATIVKMADKAGNSSEAVQESLKTIFKNNRHFIKLKNYIFIPLVGFVIYIHLILVLEIFPHIFFFDFLYKSENLPGVIILFLLHVILVVLVSWFFLNLRFKATIDAIKINMGEIGAKFIITPEVKGGVETSRAMMVE